MLEKAYHWVVSFSSRPSAVYMLALISFIESSVSPIPPLPLLIPMCIANPKRAWFYASVCAVASVAGGYLGYAIGALLYDTVGLWIINLYGLVEKAKELERTANDVWIWVLLTKGVTPIPYKIVTIMSGFIHFDLVQFTFGSIVARFTFFMLFAVVLNRFGDSVRVVIEKNLKVAALIMLSFIVGGFLLVPHLVG
jgi:membrane protein YqaA with SNARE-associated domain